MGLDMPEFEWNLEKAKTNKAKHGVSFELSSGTILFT
jgi:uncharacterized DUF497 family protein